MKNLHDIPNEVVPEIIDWGRWLRETPIYVGPLAGPIFFNDVEVGTSNTNNFRIMYDHIPTIDATLFGEMTRTYLVSAI